jgi:hypothetical protein
MSLARRRLAYLIASDPTEANMFASHRIVKAFAAAVMLTPICYTSALAQPMWSSAAPIEYLQYDLTPYFNLMMDSFSGYQYWRPVESAYTRLFDYAPGAVVHASDG